MWKTASGPKLPVQYKKPFIAKKPAYCSAAIPDFGKKIVTIAETFDNDKGATVA